VIEGADAARLAGQRRFEPDRWLVCSDRTYESLRDTWSEDALPGGLYRLRVKLGYLEQQPRIRLHSRLQALADAGVWRAYAVLDRLLDADLGDLQSLAIRLAPRLELRVFEWRCEVPAVLRSLALPDRQLLQALTQPGTVEPGRDAGRGPLRRPRPAWPPSGWAEHELALRCWETAARAAGPAAFEAAYGPDPIAWHRLAGWAATEAGPGVSRPAAANDADWTEVPLQPLAAQSEEDPYLPLQRRPPPASAERWSLGRYPVDGEDAVYLMLKVDADSLNDYQGRQVQVLAAGRVYDLGVIQPDGVAERRVSGSVDISQAVVRLSRKPAGDLG